MQLIGFDLETRGELQEYALQPFRAAHGLAGIRAASFSRNDKATGLLNPDPETLRSVLRKIIEQRLTIVGWNVCFDAAWLIAVGLEEEVFQLKWLDAMLLWRHAVVEPEGEDVPQNKRKSYALEAAMHEFYPESADFKDFKDFQATDASSLQRLLHRNKEDARFTVRLAERFWGLLTSKQQRVALIEAHSIPLVARTYVQGLKINKAAADKLQGDLKKAGEEAYDRLLLPHPEVSDYDLGSPAQLANLLFTTWGLPVGNLSKKTGNPSTDKYVLADLAVSHPHVALVKVIRESKNCGTKYAKGSLDALEYNGDGYVRPGMRIFGTYTSRATYASKQKQTIVEEKRKKNKETKQLETVLVEKKIQLPTGIALHQWKRGKAFRSLIEPPPGYGLLELDFAGQEFRWMAVASKDETMLSLCEPGEDAHSYMGAQVAEVDYRELIRRVHEEDPEAANQRKCGKFCIAEGELVLTDQGLVPIEHVSLDYRVWDGVEWVRHEGLIYQGEREVMTYDGLTATPDHEVFVSDGRKMRFDQAAAESHRLARTGNGRMPVRFVDYLFSGGEEGRVSSRDPGAMSLQVRTRVVDPRSQSGQREIDAVQGLCFETETSERRSCDHQREENCSCPEEMQRDETTVRESKGPSVQELRGAGYPVPICECGRSDTLHSQGTSTPDILGCGHRPEGQQRTLCSREPSACDKAGKSEQHTNKSDNQVQRCKDTSNPCIPRSENTLPGDTIYTRHNLEFNNTRAGHRSDKRPVLPNIKQTKRTYDLANAGPRHRFTVSGCLIMNCNLSYQYRVSAKTATVKARIDYGLDVDQVFIQRTQDIYRSSYIGVGGPPGRVIGGYWRDQIYKCKQLGYAETFAGRRVQLRGNWSSRNEAWALESTAINYPIQGTGGDQKYLAMAIAKNHLPKFDGYFYYELHDGLFYIFPWSKIEQAGRYFRKMLSNLPYKEAWDLDLPIKFPVDGKIGPSWGGLKEFE